jgi:predicted phosphodiesterase
MPPITRFPIPTDRIGLLGDVHGRSETTKPMFEAFGQAGVSVVVQLGDLGLPFHLRGSRGRREWAHIRNLQRYAEDAGVSTFTSVRGNHEQMDVLAELEDSDGFARLNDAPAIRIAPRIALAASPSGCRLALVSGAGSVDRSYRYPGASWFKNEVLSQDERDALVAEAAGQVDVVLSHDTPGSADDRTEVGRRLQADVGMWDPSDLAYATWENTLHTRMVAKLIDRRGALSVSGHLHFGHEETTTVYGPPLRIVVLADTQSRPLDSYAILDVSDPTHPTITRADPVTGRFN